MRCCQQEVAALALHACQSFQLNACLPGRCLSAARAGKGSERVETPASPGRPQDSSKPVGGGDVRTSYIEWKSRRCSLQLAAAMQCVHCSKVGSTHWRRSGSSSGIPAQPYSAVATVCCLGIA